ncbi:TPA: restriction endonuclease subunit S [Staphylococcus argenteus]|nr:restriction endonuclease subunit S [Staphylococcus argenteus]
MSNTQKKNVPELRFPEFEGEWEEKELGEIFQIISGSTPLKSNKEFYENGNINWVKTTDLNNSKVTHSKEKITEYAMKSLKLKLVPKNSVLIAMYGGFNQIGRTGLLKIDATINQAISALLMNHETNPEFIQAYLNYQVKGWKRYAASSRKDPNITKKDIEQFKVPYISINEQQKIGEFFSKLDRQIELQEQKLELLQQQKKGYMQKIFSQELRYKDENGNDYPEWEKKKLKEIAYVYTGNTPSKKENIYWNKGEYVWVTPTDIDNSKNIYESEHKLTQEGYKKARQLPKNTLLITCIASIGKNAILRKQGSCNQQINAVVPFENINIDYLYYISDSLSMFMKSIAGKTATQIVNKNTFENLEIYLASFEEQNKIADLISSLEELIERQASKLIKMKRLKQGLLQKMLI